MRGKIEVHAHVACARPRPAPPAPTQSMEQPMPFHGPVQRQLREEHSVREQLEEEVQDRFPADPCLELDRVFEETQAQRRLGQERARQKAEAERQRRETEAYWEAFRD